MKFKLNKKLKESSSLIKFILIIILLISLIWFICGMAYNAGYYDGHTAMFHFCQHVLGYE